MTFAAWPVMCQSCRAITAANFKELPLKCLKAAPWSICIASRSSRFPNALRWTSKTPSTPCMCAMTISPPRLNLFSRVRFSAAHSLKAHSQGPQLLARDGVDAALPNDVMMRQAYDAEGHERSERAL